MENRCRTCIRMVAGCYKETETVLDSVRLRLLIWWLLGSIGAGGLITIIAALVGANNPEGSCCASGCQYWQVDFLATRRPLVVRFNSCPVYLPGWRHTSMVSPLLKSFTWKVPIHTFSGFCQAGDLQTTDDIGEGDSPHAAHHRPRLTLRGVKLISCLALDCLRSHPSCGFEKSLRGQYSHSSFQCWSVSGGQSLVSAASSETRVE